MYLPLLLSMLLGTTIADIAVYNAKCFNACTQLQTSFNAMGKSIVAGTYGNANLSANYWSAQQGTLVPACVIYPTSAADVLAIVTKVEALQCKFAIRSGGHTPFRGASNIADGITVDLSSINEVTVSSDKKRVVIGGGLKWGQVSAKLDAVGLAVAGARNANVGVGGLLLGGGIGFLSGMYGLGCNNIINYEVVVGGKILQVNATSYPDLFFALRGGSNNFGAVTRFTARAFPQGPMWGGRGNYIIDQFPALINAMVGMITQAPSDPKAHLVVALQYLASAGKWTAFAEIQDAGPAFNPPILQNFTAIPSTSNNFRGGPLTAFSADLGSKDIYGLQESFWTFTYKHDPIFPHKIWDLCRAVANTSQAAREVPGFGVSCIYQPLTIPVLQQSLLNGGNALGLTADRALVVFMLAIRWSNAVDEPRIFDFATNFINNATNMADAMGLDHDFIYLNNASPEQDPFGSYGPGNLGKLRAASRKYDPKGTFQNLVPGGFKLWCKTDK